MTRQKTFKQKIRARMERTGERYASARLHLLTGQRDIHSPTARLMEVTSSVDEAELFVASGGTGFLYFLAEYTGAGPEAEAKVAGPQATKSLRTRAGPEAEAKVAGPLLTMVCRSWSMPSVLIERALEHADIPHVAFATGSAKKAQKDLDEVLARGDRALVLVDETALPWRGVDRMWRGFQPRAVVVHDKSGEEYIVSDGKKRTMSAAQLADARAAIKKQKHKMYVTSGPPRASKRAMLTTSLSSTKTSYLESPKKGFASNFGLRGLEKAARLMKDDKDKKSWAKVFNSGPFAHRALLRTWSCTTLEFTPPAGGRALYADGLERLGAKEALVQKVRDSGARFEALADAALELGGARLREAAEMSERMDAMARTGDDGDAILKLRKERDALEQGAEMNAEKRREAFNALGDVMADIVELEREVVDLLA